MGWRQKCISLNFETYKAGHSLYLDHIGSAPVSPLVSTSLPLKIIVGFRLFAVSYFGDTFVAVFEEAASSIQWRNITYPPWLQFAALIWRRLALLVKIWPLRYHFTYLNFEFIINVWIFIRKGGGVRHWPWPWHPGIYPMVNGQKSWPWPWHPRFCPWSMVKLTNFDHLTTEILKFWSWSWSKMANFDHLTTVILAMVMVKIFWPFDHDTRT